MAEDAQDRPLLLELAKESFRQQVAKRVRPLARSFVERWMNCELWLYPSVIQRHGNELHSYKAVVLETLRKTSLDEMLSICPDSRPASPARRPSSRGSSCWSRAIRSPTPLRSSPLGDRSPEGSTSSRGRVSESVPAPQPRGFSWHGRSSEPLPRRSQRPRT